MADRHFFRGHKGRGSYDLFSSYNHYQPGFKGMMALLFLFILGALLGNVATTGLQFIFGKEFAEEFGVLISYPVMFFPPLLFASVKSRLNEYTTEDIPLDKGGFSRKTWCIFIAASIVSTIATAYIVEPISLLLPDMPVWMEKAMDQLLKNSPVWVSFISVSIFAPLFEEWMCRGLVLRGMLRRMNPTSAIAVSAVFFAILHMNPWQAIPAFCLGLLFGYVYYKTGSLKLTMLMHFANNTLALIASKIPQMKDADTFLDILSPWAYGCIYAACLMIVASSVIIFNRPEKQAS